MFDWEKYNAEIKKKNNKTIFLFFGLWVVYTVLIGVALAQLSSTLFLGLGFAGYILSSFGIAYLGYYYSRSLHLTYAGRLLRECAEDFVAEHKLEKEWKEFAGSGGEFFAKMK